jgi:hypothetical protein
VILCDPLARQSFLVRLWAEPDADHPAVRGFIQDVRTGRKTYFHDLDLPVGLLRESAARLEGDDRSVLC